MKVAALVLGIIAGVIGLIGGSCAFAVGGIGEAFEVEGSETVSNLGILAFVAGITGMVGAALSISKPRTASVIMAVSGIAGLIAVSFAFIFATILFGIAALLAFLGRNSSKAVE